MRTPPPAYFQMRAAYARWFWKLPAGLLLMALAMLTRRPRRGDPQFLAKALSAAAAFVLLDSVKDRAVYESSRGTYESTPDTTP